MEIDVKIKITNNKLKNAIDSLETSGYTEESIKEVIRQLIPAKLYIAAKVNNSVKIDLDKTKRGSISDKLDIDVDQTIRLARMYRKDLGEMILVFTDMEEFEKHTKAGYDHTPHIIEFTELAGFIEKFPYCNGIIVNPYGNTLPITKQVLNEMYNIISDTSND